MRKNIAAYLALFSLIFVGASCSSSDDETATTGGTPYAYAYAFSIGNIKSPFHDFTVEGKDTIVEKIVSGDEFKFVIDQKAKEIYNVDSLKYGTRVDKVVSYLSCSGVPFRYDAALGSYAYFSSTDSVDFTSPVNVCITSSDGTYNNYYTIKLNVHKVDPDLMVWDLFTGAALDNMSPVKIFEKGGEIYVFGTDDAGNAVVAVAADAEASAWNRITLSAPAQCDLSSLQLFGDKFYMLASGDVYESGDAQAWVSASAGNSFVSLFAVSDGGTKMWAATADNIFYTTDGVTFLQSEPLSGDFPVYGCSSVNSTLSTNAAITRTILMGFTDKEKSGEVQVWSRLSNSGEWYKYEFGDNKYTCPPFKGLVVVGYDKAMYAFGGAAVIGDEEVLPFNKFYISHDNGVVWKPCTDYAVSLPAELKGRDVPFAATVSQDNYMWIAVPGAAWRGRINRLGFK